MTILDSYMVEAGDVFHLPLFRYHPGGVEIAVLLINYYYFALVWITDDRTSELAEERLCKN